MFLPHTPNVIALTAQIVTAHHARNQVSPESVHAALLAAGTLLVAATVAYFFTSNPDVDIGSA